MSLSYRPDLWLNPETGESTPHRAALGFLFELIRDGVSEEDAAVKLFENFNYFKTENHARNFVSRNLHLVKRYIYHHEKLRTVKDNNYRRVICALTRAGAAKASELKVFGQGRGGKYVKRLSAICVERHLRRARKEGLATVDRYGVWRLTKQVDLNTQVVYMPFYARHIPNDLQTPSNSSLTDDQCSNSSLPDEHKLFMRRMIDDQCSMEFDQRMSDSSLSTTDKTQDRSLTDSDHRLFKRWMIDDHSSRRFNDWRLFSSSMTDDHRLFSDLMTDSLSTDRDRLGSFDSDEENGVRRRAQLTKTRDFTLFLHSGYLHRASCSRESG